MLYDLTRFCLDLLDIYSLVPDTEKPKKTLTSVAFGSLDSLEALVTEHSIRSDEVRLEQAQAEKKAKKGLFGSILDKSSHFTSSSSKNKKNNNTWSGGDAPQLQNTDGLLEQNTPSSTVSTPSMAREKQER